MNRREEIETLLTLIGDEEAIFFDGFDEAIVGVGTQQHKGPLVIYDRSKCIQILMDRDGMAHEEAEEFFSFNTEGCWVGERTPIIMEHVESIAERE